MEISKMETLKLLFVEDDESLAFIVTGSLGLMGDYEIHRAANGEEGLELYKQIRPDIVVADIEMPGMSGLEMVQEIRKTDAKTLIVFASARKSPQEFIEGIHTGADYFIRKPYLPEELHIQLITLLKRINSNNAAAADHSSNLLLGNCLLDTHTRTLQIRGENCVQLTEREMKILKFLFEKKGEVVKREDILSALWGNNDFYTTRSLDVFMASIRKHLKEDPSIKIQTIRGEGFQLIVQE
jgi:Response regulators consisting of a CheY-like receiver domain and a winged-helix DNA-binding domain